MEVITALPINPTVEAGLQVNPDQHVIPNIAVVDVDRAESIIPGIGGPFPPRGQIDA